METDNLTNQKCNGVTGIIVIGGDGTINRAVNQLNCFDLPIGIVPGGSGNDFIKSINIGKGLNEQIKTAVHGEVMAIDMGDCNGRLFVNGFGLGFDGQIAYEFDQNRTILKGHAAYYYHVLRILAGYKPRQLKFEIDGKGYEEKILLIAVSKGTTFGGGFKLTPHARLNDGKFAICLIKDLKPIKRFLNLGLLKDGTHSKLPEVELLKGTQIKIHRQENMIAHVDGEIVGRPPYELKIIDRKLRLRVGNTAFN
ncbi:MAG: diacylglycerol kinase family lipid kinase [Bacteroidetes bacterium]|nr:diacylglycerol kinase family lipid kinase [Bacteroidota bacterium]MDA1119111.1 diacylglycerol kinase family lipid kinase [Bacteroidota bacterium]